MSSEIDHPQQRTVAELLAAHGDAAVTGRRRRRRRDAEPDAVEPVDDAAFVYGGAAPDVARWSPDRSVLRDPVPPDDGTATWDPMGAGRPSNGSAPWDVGGTGDGGRADVADSSPRWRGADGGGPVPFDRAPINGYADDGPANIRPPAGGSDARDLNRGDLNRGDLNRGDLDRSDLDRYRPADNGPGGFGPGPIVGGAGAWAGGGSGDGGANGRAPDGGPSGGVNDRPNVDAAGAGGRNGRGQGVVNGWSGRPDADASSWSSGGSPDRFGSDVPAANGWAQGGFPADTAGAVGDPNAETAYTDGQRRNGAAHRPPAGGANGNLPYRSDRYANNSPGSDPYGNNSPGSDPYGNNSPGSDPYGNNSTGSDPNRGDRRGGRPGVNSRPVSGAAFTGTVADVEPGRAQDGTARFAAPPREAVRRPRVGDAQPVPRRAPDNFAEQFSPVRADSTAVLHPGLARPLSPAPGVEADRDTGPPTQASGPFDLDDQRPAGPGQAGPGHAGPGQAGPGQAGLGRAGSGRDQVEPDIYGGDLADPDVDDPPAAQGRTRRKNSSRSSSSGQAWAGVVAQWILGAVGGAALWVGFRFLWQELTVVAIAAAVLVTVGLVLVVRHLLRNDDRRTTVFAVLIGLLLTVSPALLVLLHR